MKNEVPESPSGALDPIEGNKVILLFQLPHVSSDDFSFLSSGTGEGDNLYSPQCLLANVCMPCILHTGILCYCPFPVPDVGTGAWQRRWILALDKDVEWDYKRRHSFCGLWVKNLSRWGEKSRQINMHELLSNNWKLYCLNFPPTPTNWPLHNQNGVCVTRKFKIQLAPPLCTHIL